jgi:SAM-dependent methyltransferase
MNKNKEYYDDFFKKFGADAHLDPARFLKIASLCKGNVLDIACGTGHLADFYNGQYHGIDISSVAIDYAKKLRRLSAEFSCIDAVNFLPFGFRKFDTVVFAEFLEHIENDENIFFALKKMLKPNGRIVVSVPNGDRIPDESHLRTFTVPELRKKFSEFGNVKFYNWTGFEKRIIMTCDVGELSPKKLTLAIIAKNEGLGLENAILSCIDRVDNIAISVDDLSSDNTLEVARRYADFLKTHQWDNDFAKARNQLQNCIGSEWVLWLDGHEYVEKMPDLTNALNKPQDGYFVKIKLENNFEFFFARLIRREVKWEHAVHNNPCVHDAKRIDTFTIVHDRANLQSKNGAALRDIQRDKMVTSLFRAEIKKNRKSSRPYFYLAQHASYCKNLKQAIRFYKKCFKRSIKKDERWLCWWEIASIHSYKGQYTRALLAFEKADKEMPGRWEIAWSLGLMWALTGNTDMSLNYFVKALEPPKESFMYSPMKYDEALIFDYIGAGLYSKNKPDEAKIAWRRSLEIELKKPPEQQDKNRIEIQKRMTA